MLATRDFDRLADVARSLADADALDDICDALERKELTVATGSAVRHRLAGGRSRINRLIRETQGFWIETFPDLGATAIAAALRAASAAAHIERTSASTVQLVWTGPLVEGSFLRSTLPVMEEVIRGAKQRLLIVGYWLSLYGSQGGVQELIELIANAAKAGVTVTCVFDSGKKPYGDDNLTALVRGWPDSVDLPTILAWDHNSSDPHRKLHAKVLVADRRDSLVTSANLTQHAFDINMEMGVRVSGRPARRIAKHFELLAARGVLREVIPEQEGIG